jgi:hypothetical protein
MTAKAKAKEHHPHSQRQERIVLSKGSESAAFHDDDEIDVFSR